MNIFSNYWNYAIAKIMIIVQNMEITEIIRIIARIESMQIIEIMGIKLKHHAHIHAWWGVCACMHCWIHWCRRDVLRLCMPTCPKVQDCKRPHLHIYREFTESSSGANCIYREFTENFIRCLWLRIYREVLCTYARTHKRNKTQKCETMRTQKTCKHKNVKICKHHKKGISENM